MHPPAPLVSEPHIVGPKRMSNIAKLVIFALVSFTIFAGLFLIPHGGSSAPPHSNDDASSSSSRSGGGGLKRPLVSKPPALATEKVAEGEMDPAVKDFFMGAPPVKCPDVVFDAAEIAAHHSDEDNLWIVVNGMVLDVAKFIPSHPGGKAILNGAGGKDAAEMFSQYHQPSTAGLFGKFCVGRLAK